MLQSLIQQVHHVEADFGHAELFYRGQASREWSLLPTLARGGWHPDLESIAYYDFVTRAGNLLSPDDSGWSHLFAMQHHGIPTRLLDWTTTFGVALFFAIREAVGDAAIWVLDPFALNKTSTESETIPAPRDLQPDYYTAFISGEKKLHGKVIAISPIRFGARVLNQRAAFTLHVDLSKPLEELYPNVVRKIVIPEAARVVAKDFLRLAGISEFSLFPDLEGLSRDLRSEHFC